MIRSVIHPQTRAMHRVHLKRHRRAWFIVTGIICAAVLFTSFGYFGGDTWVMIGEAVLQTTYRLLLAYGIALILGVSIALLVAGADLANAQF